MMNAAVETMLQRMIETVDRVDFNEQANYRCMIRLRDLLVSEGISEVSAAMYVSAVKYNVSESTLDKYPAEVDRLLIALAHMIVRMEAQCEKDFPKFVVPNVVHALTLNSNSELNLNW